jgi:hypothetical protein
MSRVLDAIHAHSTFAAAYVAIGCILGLVSLLSARRHAREGSLVMFFLGHALWPITLALLVIAACRMPAD